MNKIISKIPSRIENAQVDELGNPMEVTGAKDILDDEKGKRQNVINQEVDEAIGNDETSGSIKGRIKELENQVGEGGTVDERIAEAKSEVIGGASSDYNTLKKAEDKIEQKANSADVYAKTETYNKTEVDSMISDKDHVDYFDFDTYAEMEAFTGHTDGAVYRVANYDGTQVVTNKYAEYSWDGSEYHLMAVRDHGVDDRPIKGSNNLVKSGGVYDVLKPMNEEYVDFDIPSTGYYLKTDGTEFQNWNGAATDYIPVEKGYDFIFSCVGGMYCRILGYDVDKLNPIQLYVNNSGTKTNHIYISDSSIKYIRVSANDNDSAKYLHLMNNSTYQKIVSDMSEIKNVGYDGFEDAITGSYINPTGEIKNATYGQYKDFVVYKGTKIKIISGYIHPSHQTVIGKKLSSNKYQPLVLSSQVSSWPYEYVCEENMTVGISFYYGTQEYISIEFSTNYAKSALQSVMALESQNADKEQQALIQNIELGFLFNKIAVIGDSMSVATMDGYQPPLGAAWLSFLAKRWDCQGKEFYASGGTTCYNWLNSSSYGLGKLIGDETIYNCYFIAYGHNDIGAYSVGEATDEAAPVTVTEGVPSCPTGYSFCAYYKAIIDKIRAKAPHAMIFCLCSYDNVIKETSVAEAIEDIVEFYYNNGDKLVHCLDTGGVPLSDMQIGGHYSTIGYAYIASKVNEEANKVIYQYRADEEIKSFGVYNL